MHGVIQVRVSSSDPIGVLLFVSEDSQSIGASARYHSYNVSSLCSPF